MPSTKILVSNLKTDLSVLIKNHDDDYQPHVDRALELLKNMTDASEAFATYSFDNLASLYSCAAESTESKDKTSLMLARLNQMTITKLSQIKDELRSLKKVLLQNNKELMDLVQDVMVPFVDDYNKRLQNINVKRPHGFFKSKEALELKAEIKAFCGRYYGKARLQYILLQREYTLRSYNRMQALLVEVGRDATKHSIAPYKKDLPKACDTPSPALLAAPKQKKAQDIIYEHASNSRK